MNPAIIALASAASWGSSDFLGGMAARRISPYQAVAMAHVFSLACILSAVALLRLPMAAHPAIELGLVAGVFGGGGLMLFYEALSLGAMGLTTAIAGVLTAAVPVVFSLVTEGLPKVHQLFGFGIAIAAIWMIAAAPSSSERVRSRTLWLGAISGSCFGIYFVLLKLAVAGNGAGVLAGVLWAITCSRVASSTLAIFICASIAVKRPVSAGKSKIWNLRVLGMAAAIGLLDMSGNLLYVLAAQLGRMDIAAVLSSLYPAVTILLAVWILKERTSRIQTFGMALALAAVALIAT